MDCLEGLKKLPNNHVDCVVTSPPYFGLRDYGVEGQLGLESTPDDFINRLLNIFTEIKRVLKPTGTVWVNLGDSYAGSGFGGGGKQDTNKGSGSLKGRGNKNYGYKPKDLIGIPWKFAFAMQNEGWWLRQDIIWAKPNPMPESVQDRCTRSHEYIFMFTKARKYFYDAKAVRTPFAKSSISRFNQDLELQKGSSRANGGAKTNGTMKAVGGFKTDKQRGHSRRHAGFNNRWDSMTKEEQMANGANRKSVWSIATKPFKDAHFATFPPELPELCIKAGCPENGLVLDPFMGAGTTALVAWQLKRDFIGFELNPAYVIIANNRLTNYLLS